MPNDTQRLQSIPCPCCKSELESEPYTPSADGRPPTAKKYVDCLRRCGKCRIGVSNGRSPVVIYEDPMKNVPEKVREGCLATLGQSINVQNRKNKPHAFSSANSEDAVTWTLFSYLNEAELIRSTLNQAGVDIGNDHEQEPRMLLWGAPVPLSSIDHQNLSQSLINVIDDIERKPKSRTEPDVVLDYRDAGVVFIEAKYKDTNAREPVESIKWDRYVTDTDAFIDIEALKQSQCYELARNWRVCWEYRRGRRMCLINLGTKETFQGREQERINQFQQGLNLSINCRFQCLTWSDIISSIDDPPDWLTQYVQKKGLCD